MTADLDIKFVSEVDLGPVLSELKQRLNLNIELASPDLFIPPLPGWEERSEFIQREGKLDFFHFDLYSQALSKIERGFDRDLDDVAAMIKTAGVDRARLLEFFLAIKP
jgi:curved DNA-binding protein CbpA